MDRGGEGRGLKEGWKWSVGACKNGDARSAVQR